MGFFKKLFTGIGFAAGFLFFGCLSVIVYASRGRHKPRHRRSSFWNTLERYLIFSWICDGVRSSRKRAEKSYYRRTGSDFWQTQKQARPESVKNTAPAEKKSKPEAKNTDTGATRSVKPKKTGPSSAAQKASAAQSSVQNVSVPTVLGQNVSEADAKKHGERSEPKPEPKQEHVAQQLEAKEVHQKSAQQLEAERQQKLETLRTAMQKQICAIHADLIGLAQKIQSTGGMVMDFTAFDTQKIKKYTEQAKKEWGETPEYKEFEEKTAHKTEKEVKDMSSQLMDIVAAFGGMQSKDPADSEVQAQVKKLQEFITEHYYNCSKVILNQLGQMYGAGGAFTENINAAGGAGAAEFAQKAIEIYCK